MLQHVWKTAINSLVYLLSWLSHKTTYWIILHLNVLWTYTNGNNTIAHNHLYFYCISILKHIEVTGVLISCYIKKTKLNSISTLACYALRISVHVLDMTFTIFVTVMLAVVNKHITAPEHMHTSDFAWNGKKKTQKPNIWDR